MLALVKMRFGNSCLPFDLEMEADEKLRRRSQDTAARLIQCELLCFLSAAPTACDTQSAVFEPMHTYIYRSLTRARWYRQDGRVGVENGSHASRSYHDRRGEKELGNNGRDRALLGYDSGNQKISHLRQQTEGNRPPLLGTTWLCLLCSCWWFAAAV